MSESKMYKMRIDVEPKRISEDSENRVYMSLVRVQIPSKWERFKASLLPAVRSAARVSFKLFVSFVIAFATAVVSFRLAYMERQYEAIGGEYLLVIMVFFATYWAMGKIVGYAEWEDNE